MLYPMFPILSLEREKTTPADTNANYTRTFPENSENSSPTAAGREREANRYTHTFIPDDVRGRVPSDLHFANKSPRSSNREESFDYIHRSPRTGLLETLSRSLPGRKGYPHPASACVQDLGCKAENPQYKCQVRRFSGFVGGKLAYLRPSFLPCTLLRVFYLLPAWWGSFWCLGGRWGFVGALRCLVILLMDVLGKRLILIRKDRLNLSL